MVHVRMLASHTVLRKFCLAMRVVLGLGWSGWGLMCISIFKVLVPESAVQVVLKMTERTAGKNVKTGD